MKDQKAKDMTIMENEKMTAKRADGKHREKKRHLDGRHGSCTRTAGA